MASQPPANSQLPLFYQNLIPLSSHEHGNFRTRRPESAEFLAKAHAVPITVDEFMAAQRFYPIVFSTGDNPVPLALMGLNEGVNTFVDDKGALIREAYVPAYIRRYPFMLARVNPDADEMSLCFDPTTDMVGAFEEGDALFEDGKPSRVTSEILQFCEDFEIAAQRTNAFVKELQDAELLIDGEVSIQPTDAEQPFVYRGFQMVADEKFRELRGDELRKMNQNGMLPLIVAHLISLPMIRDIFSRQMQMGKVPAPQGAVGTSAEG